MKLNRVVFVVLLSLSTLFASSTSDIKEEKISFIQFKKITLENLFDYLSSRYDVNIVLEEPMLRYYTTSIRLKNATIEEIIEIVTKEHALHYVKKDQTYYISTRRKYHTDNYSEQEYITRNVKIRYASIIDVVFLLKDVMQGTAVVRTNTSNKPYSGLFDASPKLEEQTIAENGDDGVFPTIRDNAEGSSGGAMQMSADIMKEGMMMSAPQDSVPSRIIYIVPFFNENIIYLISRDKDLINKAKSYIAEVDQPIKEVVIQGKIISVDISDGFESAFDFISQSSDIKTPIASSLASVGNVQYAFLDSLNSANIKILQDEGKAKTIASPMLLTANRNTAKLNLSEEISILKGWTSGKTIAVEGSAPIIVKPAPIYQSTDIGTKFEIIPFINDDGEILLKIKITISTVKINSQKMLVPDEFGQYVSQNFDGVNETTIETTLITKDGQGIVLGGLINESIEKQESKVPILGDIPGLGFFFKDVKDVTKKSETVVILTPYIVDIKNHNAKKMVDDLKDDIKKDHNILKDDEVKLDSKRIIDGVLDRDTLEIEE